MRRVLKKIYTFFCGQSSGTSGLHEVPTFQLDDQVRNCAVHLEDTELLAKLSTAEMEAALDAKYHAKYLVSLYS